MLAQGEKSWTWLTRACWESFSPGTWWWQREPEACRETRDESWELVRRRTRRRAAATGAGVLSPRGMDTQQPKDTCLRKVFFYVHPIEVVLQKGETGWFWMTFPLPLPHRVHLVCSSRPPVPACAKASLLRHGITRPVSYVWDSSVRRSLRLTNNLYQWHMCSGRFGHTPYGSS